MIYVGLFLLIIVATFAIGYLLGGSRVSRWMLSGVAWQSFWWIVAFHAALVPIAVAGQSIAGEKERRTLDFLLGTPLSSAEIILGKLLACLFQFGMYVAAGVPVMLVLHVLGGVDVGLILLAYAALACLALFLTGMSIWISTAAADARRAISHSVLFMLAWLTLPMLVSLLGRRFFPGLPNFIFTANAWVLASSPVGLLLRIGGGATKAGLLSAVLRMSGLQLSVGVVFVLWSIARLRREFRISRSGEKTGLLYRLIRPGWRFRPRPAVSDDPILWREMTTTRENFVIRMIGLVLMLGIYGTLGYFTFFFARPAFIELWQHGYAGGPASLAPAGSDWLMRFFMPAAGPGAPVDLARNEFSSFLRAITCPLVFLVTLVALGAAAEAIATERARGTWDSLLATSLSARDILRSKMRASAWRLRYTALTLLVLWTLGLAAGAIHPLGYIAAALVTATACWLYLNFALLASVKATDLARAMNPSIGLYFLVDGLVAFIYLMPRQFGSVLWGVGAPPFVALLSLATYRDVRMLLADSEAPVLKLMNINTGEGAFSIVATIVIAIVAQTLGGLFLWQYTVAQFDRLVGRPWRPAPAASDGSRARAAPAGLAQLPSTVARA
jgi:ABC-type Na+ efflux pump permease subunit